MRETDKLQPIERLSQEKLEQHLKTIGLFDNLSEKGRSILTTICIYNANEGNPYYSDIKEFMNRTLAEDKLLSVGEIGSIKMMLGQFAQYESELKKKDEFSPGLAFALFGAVVILFALAVPFISAISVGATGAALMPFFASSVGIISLVTAATVFAGGVVMVAHGANVVRQENSKTAATEKMGAQETKETVEKQIDVERQSIKPKPAPWTPGLPTIGEEKAEEVAAMQPKSPVPLTPEGRGEAKAEAAHMKKGGNIRRQEQHNVELKGQDQHNVALEGGKHASDEDKKRSEAAGKGNSNERGH